MSETINYNISQAKASRTDVNMYAIIQSAFIILKAAGVTKIAAWSWTMVFVPTWILLAFLVLTVILSAGARAFAKA